MWVEKVVLTVFFESLLGTRVMFWNRPWAGTGGKGKEEGEGKGGG